MPGVASPWEFTVAIVVLSVCDIVEVRNKNQWMSEEKTVVLRKYATHIKKFNSN